ncbi:MAG: LytTR family transcriptional regulator [Cyclobacteriaceae bacterium]
MLKFTRQPYPFYYEGKSLLAIMGLLFLMTFIFNYAFEPFNVTYAEHKMDYIWISAIHSLTPAIAIFFLSLAGIALKVEAKWNIWKEALFISFFFLTVGIIQFLIRDLIYDNANNWSWQYLLEEVKNTFMVGSLFAAILLPINFNRLNTQNIRNARVLNDTITEESQASTPKNIIRIEETELDLTQFIFAKAEGNYLEIHLNNHPKKLIRATLKNLETLLANHSHLIKTHRSYLVNSNYIEKVTGNAQGYQLLIKNHKVPVSRNMIEDFNKKFNRRS